MMKKHFLASSSKERDRSNDRVYELLGAEVYLYFDVEDANFTARVNPRTTARVGDTIRLGFGTPKIHVFDKETEQVIVN